MADPTITPDAMIEWLDTAWMNFSVDWVRRDELDRTKFSRDAQMKMVSAIKDFIKDAEADARELAEALKELMNVAFPDENDSSENFQAAFLKAKAALIQAGVEWSE